MTALIPGALPDATARRRITGADPAGLSETLFVEAGAGSGKTRALVERVVALVRGGVELRAIAAITFTEKAATELRDRLRGALRGAALADPGSPARWRLALEQLDGAAIGTLHAFAQRLLTERPIEAGLPPNADVLDEVSSEVDFDERWERFRGDLLDDGGLRRPLLLAFAAGVGLADLRSLALAFDANWDLLAERVPWAATDTEPPPVDIGAVLARTLALEGEAADCRDGSDLLCERIRELADYCRRLSLAPDEYECLRLLGDRDTRPSCRVGSRGRKANWDDIVSVREQVAALGEEIEDLHGRVGQACLRRLAVAVRDFTVEAAAERRAAGRLSFHDLLVLARALLRGPYGAQVREAAARRYRHILLDEFQDTDPIQIEIAVLLASPDPDAGTKPWSEVETRPGALFFVGDPKQSIYRFRRADIGLFLAARDAFSTTPLQLVTNFRTTPPVLDWVNHAFGRLIVAEAGSQPGYEPLAPSPSRTVPPVGPAVAVLGAVEHLDEPDADTLRAREAADVAGAIVEIVTGGWQVRDGSAPGGERWRGAGLGDVTVLIPARTSLPALESALEERAIPYRAETSSLVYSTPEVRDLFAVLRALADPTDQLALVTALRSPLFGCGDDDLATYKLAHRGRWDLSRPPRDDLPADHPVVEALAALHSWYGEAHWLAPSELLDRIARERRMFELAFAGERPREVWRRLRFVVDQAREWGERSGGTLREYVAWAALQASESARVAETVLPETDDDSVRIMTVHAAKGLEFPITIVSGLTSRPAGRRDRVQVTWPPSGPVGLRLPGRVTTEEFEAFAPVDEQMDRHERLRLLYVACTRAQDHLVVSLHRKHARAGAPPRTAAELLASAMLDYPGQTALDVDPARRLPPGAAGVAVPSPQPAAWEARRRALVEGARRPRTIAATAVARMDGEPAAAARPADTWADALHDPLDDPRVPVDPGLAKDPRDLDLPPWLKGRYGTAIGRAVHAVLQTVDLATGEGVSDAAAAQAAAEGVTGREREVEALARAALGSPAVRAAAEHPSWRETYVAAPVEGITLEGYVDLLYRTADGLVVVDYKTAGRTDDLDTRAAGYRLQAASYALALTTATGERVARCVFVFLTPSGAYERDVTDLEDAVTEVRRRLVATA
jgi:ATP-dependent exoDNAse (exonuclease V) beta subunit